jgi:hypothetical protein
MPAVSVRIACVLVVAALPTGCGHAATLPDRLAGGAVATMAERQLEVENPRLAKGSLSCPDLDLHVGATVRCLRTTALGKGRIAKVGGTVRVTSLASGGRLHVAMDSQAVEFGLTGDQLAADLRRRRLPRRPTDAVECPYLPARVGARATCHVRADRARRAVDAVVTWVDVEQYDVRYTFRARQTARRPVS